MILEDIQYVATCDSVLPKGHREQLKNIDDCYLGVSLETPAFENQSKLNASLEWISRNFKRCTILVGDSIHAYTLQILHNLPADVASASAHDLGSTFIDHTRVLLHDHTGCEFRFTRTSRIEKSTAFLDHRTTIFELFHRDPAFSRSIIKSAESFLTRRRAIQPGATKLRDRATALSCRYLLEELAVFAYMVECGHRVEIYPGAELPVLREIAYGLHPFVPVPLKSRINVSLKLKRKAYER